MTSDIKADSPDNLYQTLTAKEKFHLSVPMMIFDAEGKEINLPMVILTTREEREAKQKAYADTVAAFKAVPKKDEPSNFEELYDNHFACWTIFYATRVPNDLDKKFFMNKQQVEDQYNATELGIISQHYLDVQLNQPHLKLLDANDPEGYNKVIQQIINAGTQNDFFLNSFTTHSLKQLIHFLVSQLQNLPKDSGSSGAL